MSIRADLKPDRQACVWIVFVLYARPGFVLSHRKECFFSFNQSSQAQNWIVIKYQVSPLQMIGLLNLDAR